jgi:hypothetical protein
VVGKKGIMLFSISKFTAMPMNAKCSAHDSILLNRVRSPQEVDEKHLHRKP